MAAPHPRILKHGNPPPPVHIPWPVAICERCKCEFEYDPAKELYWTGLGNADWQAVKCPESGCGGNSPIGPTY